MPGTFPPPPRVSGPDMHHGTCVTHVPWCMLGSLTSGFFLSRRWGKTFPAFPVHAQPAILRIWQDAHGGSYEYIRQETMRCFHLVKNMHLQWYMRFNMSGAFLHRVMESSAFKLALQQVMKIRINGYMVIHSNLVLLLKFPYRHKAKCVYNHALKLIHTAT